MQFFLSIKYLWFHNYKGYIITYLNFLNSNWFVQNGKIFIKNFELLQQSRSFLIQAFSPLIKSSELYCKDVRGRVFWRYLLWRFGFRWEFFSKLNLIKCYIRVTGSRHKQTCNLSRTNIDHVFLRFWYQCKYMCPSAVGPSGDSKKSKTKSHGEMFGLQWLSGFARFSHPHVHAAIHGQIASG